ncbi:MAG: MBL fold metallo-hydrolase [Treponema sp.]|nr:MBL fold metallo-hydrolase [Treponema sp.]
MTIKKFQNTIELTNDGKLSLFFVGTGSAFSKTNYQNNLLLIKGDKHILIDCGTLCPYALETTYNTKITKIRNVILTHSHADHIGGVEEMVLLGKYVTKDPINIFIPKPFKKKLWNESLRGGIQFSEEGVMKFEDYFKELPIKKIQTKPFDIFHASLGTLDLKLFRTRHVTTRFNSLRNSQVSYGVLIDERVLFTADTQFNEPQLRFLLNKYKTIEYIFHDCDVSGYSAGVHASYDQLCTLPPEIRSKTYLCHYNEAVNEIEALVDGFAGLAKPGVYYNI